MANNRDSSKQKRARQNRAQREAREARAKAASVPAEERKAKYASSTPTDAAPTKKGRGADRPRPERKPRLGDLPVDLETLDGLERIEVKAGTQSGQTVTLRQKGVAHLRGSGRGDLHVHVDVATPPKLDAQQEELIRQLATLRGESAATTTVQAGRVEQSGLFSRLRDAFNGR